MPTSSVSVQRLRSQRVVDKQKRDQKNMGGQASGSVDSGSPILEAGFSGCIEDVGRSIKPSHQSAGVLGAGDTSPDSGHAFMGWRLPETSSCLGPAKGTSSS